jgi:hypothetical protein
VLQVGHLWPQDTFLRFHQYFKYVTVQCLKYEDGKFSNPKSKALILSIHKIVKISSGRFPFLGFDLRNSFECELICEVSRQLCSNYDKHFIHIYFKKKIVIVTILKSIVGIRCNLIWTSLGIPFHLQKFKELTFLSLTLLWIIHM